jgi:hypothetical protein
MTQSHSNFFVSSFVSFVVNPAANPTSLAATGPRRDDG